MPCIIGIQWLDSPTSTAVLCCLHNLNSRWWANPPDSPWGGICFILLQSEMTPSYLKMSSSNCVTQPMKISMSVKLIHKSTFHGCSLQSAWKDKHAEMTKKIKKINVKTMVIECMKCQGRDDKIEQTIENTKIPPIKQNETMAWY